MTNCNSWMNLSPEEQALFIGRLAVACQYDEDCFYLALNTINHAKGNGVFKVVKVGHEEVYGSEAEHGIIN